MLKRNFAGTAEVFERKCNASGVTGNAATISKGRDDQND